MKKAYNLFNRKNFEIEKIILKRRENKRIYEDSNIMSKIVLYDYLDDHKVILYSQLEELKRNIINKMC